MSRESRSRTGGHAIGVLSAVLTIAAASGAAAAHPEQHPGGTRQASPAETFRLAGDRATEILEALRDEARLPGVSAAAALDGRVVWSGGVGAADLESGAPARGDTVYRLASISKAVTGVAVADLFEDGLVDLDAPIERYLPGYPTAADTITLRMLLGHTSGIRSYRAGERDDLAPRRYATTGEALAIFQGDELEHAPGERYTYTTYGYVPVRAVVEAVEGRPFMEVVGERVLRPAGLATIAADDNRAVLPGRASFYTLEDGELINAPYIDTSYKPAGGGMVGSAEDLCRLCLALADGTLLGPSGLAELWRPVVTNGGEAHDYGMGWGLATDPRGEDYAVQIGGQIGTGTAMMLFPDSGVAAAVMTNRAGAPMGRAEVVALARLFGDAAEGVDPAAAVVPEGVFDAAITSGELSWRGSLILTNDHGRARGTLAVENTADPADRRRFRVASATASRGGGVRLFTVHPRWGVFPFDLEETEAGLVGRLDRAEDAAWTLTATRRSAGEPADAVAAGGEPKD